MHFDLLETVPQLRRASKNENDPFTKRVLQRAERALIRAAAINPKKFNPALKTVAFLDWLPRAPAAGRAAFVIVSIRRDTLGTPLFIRGVNELHTSSGAIMQLRVLPN